MTEEWMVELRWRLKEGMAEEGERLEAPFCSFVKQTRERTCCSFRTRRSRLLGGLCLETGVY